MLTPKEKRDLKEATKDPEVEALRADLREKMAQVAKESRKPQEPDSRLFRFKDQFCKERSEKPKSAVNSDVA